MTRKAKPCTEASECRSCNASVLWAEWESGKRMPVDAQPNSAFGNLVLSIRGGNTLIVAKFDPLKHGDSRNRYTSHFATCPEARDWRREGRAS